MYESLQKVFALIVACRVLLNNGTNLNIKSNSCAQKEIWEKIEYECLCILKSRKNDHRLYHFFGKCKNWKEIYSWFDINSPYISPINLRLRYIEFTEVTNAVLCDQTFQSWFSFIFEPPKPIILETSIPEQCNYQIVVSEVVQMEQISIEYIAPQISTTIIEVMQEAILIEPLESLIKSIEKVKYLSSRMITYNKGKSRFQNVPMSMKKYYLLRPPKDPTKVEMKRRPRHICQIRFHLHRSRHSNNPKDSSNRCRKFIKNLKDPGGKNRDEQNNQLLF